MRKKLYKVMAFVLATLLGMGLLAAHVGAAIQKDQVKKYRGWEGAFEDWEEDREEDWEEDWQDECDDGWDWDESESPEEQNDDWSDTFSDETEDDEDWDFYDDDTDGQEERKKPVISSKKLEISPGKKAKLSIENAEGKIEWTSSNPKIAAVSAKGMVTAKKEGKAVISAECVKEGKTLTCKVTVTKKLTALRVTQELLSMKGKYKEGKRWTNKNYYFWKAINCHCYGCIAFAGILSDKVFGKDAKVVKHRSFAKIKPGDHIRIGNYHSVIVLFVDGNTLTVAEGNYNSSIHWGRKITKAELAAEGFYVETRY